MQLEVGGGGCWGIRVAPCHDPQWRMSGGCRAPLRCQAGEVAAQVPTIERRGGGGVWGVGDEGRWLANVRQCRRGGRVACWRGVVEGLCRRGGWAARWRGLWIMKKEVKEKEKKNRGNQERRKGERI